MQGAGVPHELFFRSLKIFKILGKICQNQENSEIIL